MNGNARGLPVVGNRAATRDLPAFKTQSGTSKQLAADFGTKTKILKVMIYLRNSEFESPSYVTYSGIEELVFIQPLCVK